MNFWQGKNNEVVETGEVQSGPLTKKQKVIRHLKKYWWIHLIVFILINIIGVIIAVYVAYPAIAQSQVSAVEIVLTRQKISNPTPEGLDADIDTVFLSKSSLAPMLKSFNASVYLPNSDTPCYNVTVPGVDSASNGTNVHIKQPIVINQWNRDEFVKYSKLQLLSKNFTVSLVGDGGLKLGGLPNINVNYNQSLTIQGLNNLEGLSVTNLTLLPIKRPDGVNAIGEVMVPNPTPGTYEFGDAYVNQFVNGTFIANSTIRNLVLRPGNNTYAIESTTNVLAVAKLLLQPAYMNGILPITIAGSKAVAEDGEMLGYFTEALRANVVTTDFNIWDSVADTGQSVVGQLMDLLPELKDGLGSVGGSAGSEGSGATGAAGGSGSSGTAGGSGSSDGSGSANGSGGAATPGTSGSDADSHDSGSP